MAYIKDILSVFDESITYKMTLIGSSGIIIEGYRDVLTFSDRYIELRMGKNNRARIEGENLHIQELEGKVVTIKGKINLIDMGGEKS